MRRSDGRRFHVETPLVVHAPVRERSDPNAARLGAASAFRSGVRRGCTESASPPMLPGTRSRIRASDRRSRPLLARRTCACCVPTTEAEAVEGGRGKVPPFDEGKGDMNRLFCRHCWTQPNPVNPFCLVPHLAAGLGRRGFSIESHGSRTRRRARSDGTSPKSLMGPAPARSRRAGAGFESEVTLRRR